MPRLNRQFYIGIFAVAVIAGTFTYSIREFNRHRGEITLQLSEFAEKLALPYRILALSLEERDAELLLPIMNVRVEDIEDTWGEPRGEGRTHEGVDIFAARGTPVFSATRGYVRRAGTNNLGGNVVFVIGPGGVRYYYAHLHSIAQGIDAGEEVTTDTVLGYVGNTGNAETTPPHLHFGVYHRGAENPYPLLRDRLLPE